MSEEQAHEDTRTRQLAHLGALFAGFAHEIRNPLSTIGLNLQLVKEDFGVAQTPRDKRIRRRLTAIEGEVRRLQGILDQFLDFVRFPKLELRLTRLDDLIRELVEFMAPEMDEAGIAVRVFVESAIPPVPADPAQIRAVLVNLVRNAREASVPGSEVMLTLRREGGEVVIQVTDTGEGMSPEVCDQAFKPYFSTKKSGTGLGLSTVDRIVRMHGGSIDVASVAGKGTQFTLRLSIEQPVAAGDAVAESSPEETS